MILNENKITNLKKKKIYQNSFFIIISKIWKYNRNFI